MIIVNFVAKKIGEMIRGTFFILFFYFIGELVSVMIGRFVPGSVLGMVFLFCALFFKLIKPEYVKDAATVITKNMAVFFVPVAVGLMTYFDLLKQHWVAILAAIAVSSVLVIVSVAFVQERFEKRKGKKDESEQPQD